MFCCDAGGRPTGSDRRRLWVGSLARGVASAACSESFVSHSGLPSTHGSVAPRSGGGCMAALQGLVKSMQKMGVLKRWLRYGLRAHIEHGAFV